MPLLMLINKEALRADLPQSERGKKFYFCWITWLLTFIYSVFLPLESGTMWFYIGFPISIVGLIGFTIVIVNFATTPLDEPITRGLYRYSRHPMYVTQLVMFLGVGIASASWLFLLLSMAYSIPSLILATPEERFCLEKYGDAYREYMNRTPRYIGMPKSG